MTDATGAKRFGLFTRSLCWLLVVAGFFGIVSVQKRVVSERGVYAPIGEVLYMSSGQVLSRLSLGHQGLLADIYWTRVVQYFGRKRLNKDMRLDLLGPLLRVTVELDPHLLIAYRFGAIFLGSNPPEGAGKPKEALDILRRGIVANPDYWRLWQDIGFVYYWDLKDYRNAVKAFETGARQPGAQVWMKAVAAMVAAKGGDVQTSRVLWAEIYQHADNDLIRQSALQHLAALKAREEMDQLDRLLVRYRATQGRPAGTFEDLLLANLIRRLPKDPSGVPYVIGPDGKTLLGPRSEVKLRLLEY
jgi:hypothetical protein